MTTIDAAGSKGPLLLVQGIGVHTAPLSPLFSQPKHTAQWALVRDYLD